MRKTIILLSLIIYGVHGNCQVTSSCLAPPELREAYESDVYQLASTRIFETNSQYMDSLLIPKEVEDTIWSGLAAIYNTHSIPERDSIFDIYCIHNERCSGYPIQTLFVTVDTTFEWTQHWKNLETTSGYVELDAFLAAYSYEIKSFGRDQAELSTTEHVNVSAYADSLATFDGILKVHYGDMDCCHNIITYDNSNNISTFMFNLGWGTGHFFCWNEYLWTFQVNDCNVDLTDKKHSISKEPIPDFKIPNCHITSGIQKSKYTVNPFNIWPNPTKNFISVSVDLYGSFNISIYNMLGVRVFNSTFTDNLDISLIDYNSGLYLIDINSVDNKISYRYKIIKK